MRSLLIFTLLCVGCQSGKTGLVYIDKGMSVEASVFRAEDGTPIGLRASAGRVNLPKEWDDDWTMRYAIGPYVQIPLPLSFYLEPRFEGVIYPDLPTSFEPEAGLRLGWRYRSFEFFIGGRYPLGNGHRHEELNPPEYRHIDSGFHPELGISWGFDF